MRPLQGHGPVWRCEHRLWIRHMLPPPNRGCVTPGKWLDLSEPQLPTCETGDNDASHLLGCLAEVMR